MQFPLGLLIQDIQKKLLRGEEKDFWYFLPFIIVIPNKIFLNQMKLPLRGIYNNCIRYQPLSIHFYNLYFTRQIILNLQTPSRWFLAWDHRSLPGNHYRAEALWSSKEPWPWGLALKHKSWLFRHFWAMSAWASYLTSQFSHLQTVVGCKGEASWYM